jgi:hypothetical protein
LQVVKRSVTKCRKRLLSSEGEDTADALMIDENASPLAGSIPVNDENTSPLNEAPRRVLENITKVRKSTRRATAALHGELSPLAENVPPRRRGVPKNITLARRSSRRATAASHNELTSVLEIRGAEILTSVRNRRSSVREMEDL